ncbi:GNAT family N-acetyltransferase [Bacillus solimangrovi]|uniref:N-acetyltransferase domain-containing protein n=1 Tax=Bacillus solimangrovi TaxID=1305675 RepID=A0A1E5LJX9_9BACI|nr:GNAT family N-acetyltransferase [Bacillus solimangrovi]OEH94403.1 hypothetical protein BFG57_08045 [Bacillus solimangrovi]
MAVGWTEITNDNVEYLEKVFKLYDQTFPKEVRESHETFYKSIQYSQNSFPNTFRFLVGIENEQVVSFATGHYLAGVNSGFIVYIVTNPLIRSHGLGAKTLNQLEELLNEDAKRAGYESINSIILETETIEMVHTEQEKEDCVKRNNFFNRNGYKRLNVKYMQPPLHNDEHSIPLNLFVKNRNGKEINKKTINDSIFAIYNEKYNSVNQIDKTILNNCLVEMGIRNLD